jgi:hypothetical protein
LFEREKEIDGGNGRRVAQDLPGDEEDLALLAVVDGDEVEVEDGVAAVVAGQRGHELLVPFPGAAHLVHQHGARPLVDLVHHEAVHLLPLHLHEPALALLLHVHPLRRLQTTHAHTQSVDREPWLLDGKRLRRRRMAGARGRFYHLVRHRHGCWDGRPGEGTLVFSAWVWVSLRKPSLSSLYLPVSPAAGSFDIKIR